MDIDVVDKYGIRKVSFLVPSHSESRSLLEVDGVKINVMVFVSLITLPDSLVSPWLEPLIGRRRFHHSVWSGSF